MSLSPVRFRLVTSCEHFGGKSLWEGTSSVITQELTLDGLPIVSKHGTEQHRLHLKGFQRRLGQLDKENPQQEVFFTDNQTKYMTELASRGGNRH